MMSFRYLAAFVLVFSFISTNVAHAGLAVVCSDDTRNLASDQLSGSSLDSYTEECKGICERYFENEGLPQAENEARCTVTLDNAFMLDVPVACILKAHVYFERTIQESQVDDVTKECEDLGGTLGFPNGKSSSL